MKISIMLLLVAISAVGNAYIVPNVQCACQQIISQEECSTWNCSWQVTSAAGVTPTTGYCAELSCASFTKQQCQQANNRCYYQEIINPTGQVQVCFEFSKCEDITLAAGTTCNGSNSNCIASKQSSSQCVSAALSCSSITSQTDCSPGQNYTLASEGLCYWNGNSCKLLTSCGEIRTQSQCEQPILNHACVWNNAVCISQTCSSLYTNNGICTYVQTSPQNGSMLQACQLTNNTCAPVKESAIISFPSTTCVTNTNQHYRWVPIDATTGICAQCNPHKYVSRNQCECQQLMQKSECDGIPSCHWTSAATGTSGTCALQSCIGLDSQLVCAQTKGCYWNLYPTGTASPSCQTYTSCSTITGKTAQACVQQSIYCPGTTGTVCQSQVQLQPCSSIKQPNICFNSVGNNGYCIYENGACTNITTCSQLNSFQLCNQFSNSCIWKTGSQAQCQNKTCSDYNTESSCTYIQNNISYNTLNICAWNPNTKQCSNFDDSFSYDVNSCFNSTGRTHHWSEPQSAQKGFCLPCHYSSVLNVKSNCSCTDLTNYTDCALSSPKCYWNAASSTCQNQNCTSLTSQASCILNKYCNWSNKYGCQGNGSSSVTCSSLSANTQQECLSQSIVCAGISNGKCSSSPNSCSDFNTFYQCFGSVGTDGICQWNQSTSKCQGINTCTMINTKAQCELVLNTCYWGENNNGTLSCMGYTCSTLYSQSNNTNCNYYLSTPNQNYKVNYCSLTGGTCSETNNISSLTSSNCYSSTGGTARWDNGTCVFCYSQIISVLFIILSYML